MIKDYFTMLPNNIVWAYEDGEIALIKENDKLLITMIYLDTHITSVGECCFTLEDLIIKSGLKVDRGKGRSIEQFKNTLTFLQSVGWLDSKLDIKNLKPKEFISCAYEVQFKKEDVTENDYCFFKLYYAKFRKLMDCDTKLDKLITLKIYCYILARLKRNSSEQQDSREMQYWQDTIIEEFHDTYKKICKHLDITPNTFNLHMQLLQDLELIFFDNIGLVKNNDGSHYANNIYAETKDWLKQALSASKLYYEGKGYKCIGKKCSQKTTSIKGYKGKVKELKNAGKDTAKLEQKIEELIEPPKDNVKRIGYINGKKAPVVKQVDPSPIISCQEENYNEICYKIESGQDDWGTTNPFENPLKQMFGDDTYKMDIPKNEIQSNDFKNDYEKYRDKPYEDEIDQILLQKIN